jgi:hypothetical protein
MSYVLSILVFLSFNVLADNEIKYDFDGLTIDRDKIVFDGSRWNLSSGKNRSLYTNLANDKIKVEVVRNTSGSIVGVSDLAGNGDIRFRDAIFGGRCTQFRDTFSGCYVTHEFCSDIDNRLADLSKCTSEKGLSSVQLPTPSVDHKDTFTALETYSTLNSTSPPVKVTVEYSETLKNILQLCRDLREYSAPTITSSPSSGGESRGVVPQ